jgi:hypothetical protein
MSDIVAQRARHTLTRKEASVLARILLGETKGDRDGLELLGKNRRISHFEYLEEDRFWFAPAARCGIR